MIVIRLILLFAMIACAITGLVALFGPNDSLLHVMALPMRGVAGFALGLLIASLFGRDEPVDWVERDSPGNIFTPYGMVCLAAMVADAVLASKGASSVATFGKGLAVCGLMGMAFCRSANGGSGRNADCHCAGASTASARVVAF